MAAVGDKGSSRADHMIPTSAQMAAYSTVTLVEWNVRKGGKGKEAGKSETFASKTLTKKIKMLWPSIRSRLSVAGCTSSAAMCNKGAPAGRLGL